MKKTLLTCCLILISLLVCRPCLFAAEALALAGNDYNVFAFCLDDAGNYCNKNQIKQDEFQFTDDGSFKITSLEDNKDLLDSSSGNVDEGAGSFTGDYQVTNDNLLKKYQFSFSGITVLTEIILGQFNVKYYEFGGFPPQYDKKGESPAYFIGIRR